MTGRPVFADSARENVLFPAPAMPVTTTRRPTEFARWMSLIQTKGPGSSYSTPAHNAGCHDSRLEGTQVPEAAMIPRWIRRLSGNTGHEQAVTLLCPSEGRAPRTG